MSEEKINHPKHYNAYKGIEIIDLVEQMNFNKGNAVKCIARAGLKDPSTEIEDLKKAAWYIDREIQRISGLPVQNSNSRERVYVIPSRIGNYPMEKTETELRDHIKEFMKEEQSLRTAVNAAFFRGKNGVSIYLTKHAGWGFVEEDVAVEAGMACIYVGDEHLFDMPLEADESTREHAGRKQDREELREHVEVLRKEFPSIEEALNEALFYNSCGVSIYLYEDMSLQFVTVDKNVPVKMARVLVGGHRICEFEMMPLPAVPAVHKFYVEMNDAEKNNFLAQIRDVVNRNVMLKQHLMNAFDKGIGTLLVVTPENVFRNMGENKDVPRGFMRVCQDDFKIADLLMGTGRGNVPVNKTLSWVTHEEIINAMDKLLINHHRVKDTIKKSATINAGTDLYMHKNGSFQEIMPNFETPKYAVNVYWGNEFQFTRNFPEDDGLWQIQSS